MPKTFLNSYFGFNKQQRNGLFVLISISFFLLLVRFLYPIFIKPDNIVLLNLPLIEEKLDNNFSLGKNTTQKPFKNESSQLSLFVFNPNAVTAQQLEQLGLQEKTIRIFLKFRNKGFVFKEKKDLLKVYGITEQLYSQLEPYVLIEEEYSQQNNTKPIEPIVSENKTIKQIQKPIDLNSADSLSLVALNGIGATFAKRILKYRTILGGFVSVDQLKEVYGFNDELFEKVKGSFYVDKTLIKKLDLNKDDFKLINKHPYISFELTKQIFDWRKKTVLNSANLKDILNDATVYQKLLPYLSFE